MREQEDPGRSEAPATDERPPVATGTASSSESDAGGMRMFARASGHGRTYQAGRDLIQYRTVLPEAALRPVAEVAAPPSLVKVPGNRQVFVGRGPELAELEQALGTAGPVVVAAVHGLGGVGKSTLAARYAWAQTGRRNPVWWITADSPESVRAGLAELAVALQPELASALPPESLAERALGWLASHDGWLLVLDDVTDVEDATLVLERAPSGRVLLTSRLGEGWHRLDARVLPLDVLSERDAIELVARIMGHRPAASGRPDLDGLRELVAELGCLPLAVEQAAAYMRQARLTPRAYLEALRERPAVLYDQAARGSGAERSVARIWRLTLDRLAGVPMAGRVLRVLAWYGAEPIPRTLLERLDAPDVRHALGELAAYNMIALDGAAITVHRLVQAVARTPGQDDPHRRPADIEQARERATGLLVEALPEPRALGASPAWRALLPHITALTERTSPETDTVATARLLNRTGVLLLDEGAPQRALGCFERAYAAYRARLGADHQDTLQARANVAGAYLKMGRLDQAIPLLEATLADQERALVFGPDNPGALNTRNMLAMAHQDAGNLAKAIPLLEETLSGRERVLGRDDPATLISRLNLAAAHREAGDLGTAIPLLESTLADCERVLRPAHPDTLAVRHVLATAYQDAGLPRRAIEMYEDTIAIQKVVLGDDHPAVLISRDNLAGAYLKAGQPDRAVSLFEAVVADFERVLDPDHPDLFIARGNLADAYLRTGRPQEALPLLEATLADRMRVLSPDHTDLLASFNNLGRAYAAVGDLDRAIPLLERALGGCERVLGADHPRTREVRDTLASLRRAAAERS
ncbi:Putative ATP/GTP-binding protein [[Actinomadura] parvosata subsp. kistnae]|uniref:NB-ARC domain-containing protein n=1 Tax=[Actinomadura] parvosata subsp. kistnae TaxID=1909395 RepID=A0A1V0A1X3_9ACTN|nr:tetratricopeptide repeat protein [Nonomuraea sp. ATCC 55076]AQZ64152.1 hypothetical protein BKM31_24200 [Nonomuraea sp. ATCC 55076]SPL87363.1 Putative ATP/GTP-binding protein [Actinomadura parvosata subsp. kistnae]